MIMGSVLPKTREERARRWRGSAFQRLASEPPPAASTPCRCFSKVCPTTSTPLSLLSCISIPERQSELSNILAARTKMPVTQISGLTPIEPRHVYVIPPNRQLRATDHHLAITDVRRAALAARADRSFLPFARRPGRRQLRHRFFRRRLGRIRRHQSGQGGRRHHSGSGSGRGRVRIDAAQRQSRQVLRISFCPYARSPPGFPS